MAYNKREYDKEYSRLHIKYRKLNLNTSKQEDIALMEWIDSQPEGASNYLKRLVLADMQKNTQA